MSFSNSSLNPTSKWNDAEVFGDLDAPEAQAVLDSNVDILFGGSSKQARGTWRQLSGPLHNLIEAQLSRHKAKRSKDGEAIVFAKASHTGSFYRTRSGLDIPLRGRSKGDIEAVTFASYDIDDGEAVEVAAERLKALGYFAILYTTYTHAKTQSDICDPWIVEAARANDTVYDLAWITRLRNPKRVMLEADHDAGCMRSVYSHEPINKYRILIPLEQPFNLSPDNPRTHDRLCQEWRDRLVNFASEELKLSIDESGCDVNRLFFTPRHKPGNDNWYLGIFAGRALRFEDMPYDPTTERPRMRREQWPARQTGDGTTIFGTGQRPVLSDGFDLIDWYRDWGSKFQVREFFDVLQWEFGSVSDARGEARILCPQDHLHGSQDDVMGCWIKDGNGEQPFVVYCHHQTCAETRSLDQLASLEPHVGLPDGYVTLSELLCDATLYVIDDESSPPNRQRYLRWDPDEGEGAPAIGAEGEVVQ